MGNNVGQSQRLRVAIALAKVETGGVAKVNSGGKV
jgi:hypothetical protein